MVAVSNNLFALEFDSVVDVTSSCPFRQQLMSNTQASSKEAPQIHRLTKRIWKSGPRIWT